MVFVVALVVLVALPMNEAVAVVGQDQLLALVPAPAYVVGEALCIVGDGNNCDSKDRGPSNIPVGQRK